MPLPAHSLIKMFFYIEKEMPDILERHSTHSCVFINCVSQNAKQPKTAQKLARFAPKRMLPTLQQLVSSAVVHHETPHDEWQLDDGHNRLRMFLRVVWGWQARDCV